MMRLSVLMTMHNAGRYVAEAVGSLLAQDLADFELIVVDDGSSDDSVKIVRDLGDKRIRLVAPGRLGRTPALQLALGLAQADYVAVLDADDTCRPDRLALQCAFLDAHPQVALLGSYCRLVDASGALLEEFRPPTDHAGILACMPLYNPFAHSAVMYRRQAALAAGGYRARYAYAQDFALWLRLVARHQTANLPEFLVDLRQHGSQMTTSPAFLASRLRDGIHLISQARKLPGIPQAARRESRGFYQSYDRDYLDCLCEQGLFCRALGFLGGHLLREGPSSHAAALVRQLWGRATAPTGR
jgi:hypothetical protein